MANTSPGRWIYNTQRWRKLRERLLPGKQCHWHTPGCTIKATCLDHYPIDTHRFQVGDMRAFDPAYVVPACRRCNSHRAALLQARLKRARRARVTRRW